jgi:predicted phage replisome organizer
MADKKYYWLKLQKDFFKRHDIRIIEGMPNGKDYVLFYLKLLVESIDHEGELRFSETIPYNEDMLSTITSTNIDIVRSAMKVFTELGMIEVMDDATIFMAETQKMIGCETAWAKKKRDYREKKDNVLALSSSSPCDVRQEIEIEKDIETEKEKEKETEKKKKSKYYPMDEKLDKAFADYVAMRKQIKKPMTDRAIELAMSKLEGLAKDSFTGAMDNDVAIQILEQSVMNSWQGLFPLKQENAQANNSSSFMDKWRDA